MASLQPAAWTSNNAPLSVALLEEVWGGNGREKSL